MKKINNYTLTGIFLLIIIALTFYFLEVRETNQEVATVGVVIATQDIEANKLITKDMVTLENRFTEDQLKEQGNITSELNKVVGKRTSAPIYKNETIKLQRIMENKEYMNQELDKEKNLISIIINNTDKALEIKKGDYIDIWMEPNNKAIELQKQAKLLFEKIKIQELKDENYFTFTPGQTIEEGKLGYIIIGLDDIQTKELLNAQGDGYYSFKISHYGEHRNYEIENAKLNSLENNNVNDNSNEEAGEVE